MSSLAKKIIYSLFLVVVTIQGLTFFVPVSHAQNNITLTPGGNSSGIDTNCTDSSGSNPNCYTLDSGLAEILKTKTIDTSSLGGFINSMIAFIIGIAGIITVIMIMYDGFSYWSAGNTGATSKMGEVKGRIWKRMLGLILILTIYTILRTINPDLLNLVPRIDSADFKTGGDTESSAGGGAPVDPQQQASNYGISCPGSGGASAIPSIAQSFVGKVTYAYGAKGSAGPSNTINYDCSGFVNAVYKCAGLPSPGGGTSGIFSGATSITSIASTTVNGQALSPGDLLGWTQGSLSGNKKESAGHVVMYIGNGKTIESTSNNQGKQPGKAIQVRNADTYKITRLKFFKKAP